MIKSIKRYKNIFDNDDSHISEIQSDSLWLRAEEGERNIQKSHANNNSLNNYRDRGDSGSVRSPSIIKNNKSEWRSLYKGNSSCKNYIKRSKTNLKNKFHKKLTFLRRRNSFRSIREDTDRLKSPEGTFNVHKIFGDGNCMYRSVSYIIWGDEDEHRSLRTMVVEHIKDNWSDYSAFVMAEWNISNKREYYDYMMENGTYATELECVVATKLYHMNLSIYREIGETGRLERIFYNRVNRNYRTARLLFSGRTDSGHYDVLIPD